MSLSHFRAGRTNGDPADFFLATTSASGRPCGNYVASLADSTAYLAQNNLHYDYWLMTEDCHVDDARNVCVQQFLRMSKAPFMVFIDDDVGWNTETLVKLINWKNADVVGGAYPLKQEHEEYPIRIIGANEFMQARPDGLLEVEGIPTGFMRINRNVLERMSEKRKHMTFRPVGMMEDDVPSQVIFERMMVDGKRWSGDLNFCREVRNLGFKIWIDPEATFSHQGQKLWQGHLGNWLRQTQKIMDPGLNKAVLALIEGDETEENFTAIWKGANNHWGMGPGGLIEVYKAAKEADGPILEAGSGITSIIAGIACKRTGNQVWSLEHDLDWWRRMRDNIQHWKIPSISLVYAPLQEYEDGEYMWYEIDDALPKKFSVAIIDGPPRRYGREGIFKLMGDRIKDAKWIVDDVEDKLQMEMVRKYAEEYGKTVSELGLKIRGFRHVAVVT